MLTITIPARLGNEAYDEEKNEFITINGLEKDKTLQLEHSLVSLSKWESKWHKPFLTKNDKTVEETLDYIRCMTLDRNADPGIYKLLTKENIKEINDYIGNPMTATTFNERNQSSNNREIITSELVYYWMVALNIPFECEKWHLNRLLTLVRICNIKNQPPKKRSCGDIMRSNAELNAARRKLLNSKG